MKKVYPATTKKKKEKVHLKSMETPSFFSLWPVYSPYQIYEQSLGKWVISGDNTKYWKVWEGRIDGVKFINPTEEKSLLKDFLAINTKDDKSVLFFVNRYGLLGLDFLESSHWVVAQMPSVNFAVESEDLFDFKAAVLHFRNAYKLWREGDLESLLPILQRRLAGVREYPQMSKCGKKIFPGKAALTLWHYIWLQLYEVVLGREWAECLYCGNLYEKVHGNAKYCPSCQSLPTPPRHLKRRAQEKKEKEAVARMKPLWTQSSNSIPEEEALIRRFGDSPINLHIVTSIYNWLKETLPFRCGVRLGKDRITFLVGNYRPAAIKKQGGKVRLDMVFANRLPEGFRVASYVWRSVPNTIEGYTLVEEGIPPVTEEDKKNFVKACERMREVAPKSRRHVCNVLAAWPEEK